MSLYTMKNVALAFSGQQTKNEKNRIKRTSNEEDIVVIRRILFLLSKAVAALRAGDAVRIMLTRWMQY
jgi:hypothetical protein